MKNKRLLKKKFIFFIFGILIGGIITSSLYYSSKTSSALDYDRYEFYVGADKGSEYLELYDFTINYDFKSGQGYIEFNAKGDEKKIGMIGIGIPNSTRIINCSAKLELIKIGDDCNNLNFSEIKEKNIKIEFAVKDNDKFYPNGLFFINTEAKRIIPKNIKFTRVRTTYEKTIALFDLGGYVCESACFYNPQNITGKISGRKIYLISDNDVIHRRIELYTSNSNIEWWKNFTLAFAVGLITLVFTISITNPFKRAKEYNFYLSKKKKYHSENCSHKGKSTKSEKNTLKKIEKRGYTFCKKCIHEFRNI